MSDSIAGLGPAADATYGQDQQQRDPRTMRRRGARVETPRSADTADQRLIIEEDPASHVPVYKTVDALTGAVVQAVPEAQVQSLGRESGYVAGQLIKARV
jgi:hypothetical protein